MPVVPRSQPSGRARLREPGRPAPRRRRPGRPITAAHLHRRPALDRLPPSRRRGHSQRRPLRYHGDFDWPGIAIANSVIRRHDATPWRLSAADYQAAVREDADSREAQRPAPANPVGPGPGRRDGRAPPAPSTRNPSPTRSSPTSPLRYAPPPNVARIRETIRSASSSEIGTMSLVRSPRSAEYSSAVSSHVKSRENTSSRSPPSCLDAPDHAGGILPAAELVDDRVVGDLFSHHVSPVGNPR